MRKLLLLLMMVSAPLLAQVTTNSRVSGVQGSGLINEAPNVLVQRNDGFAQLFCVYNTYTDSANYERGCIDWNASVNNMSFSTSAAGTGTQRNIIFNAGAVISFRAAGAAMYLMSASAITPATNGVQAIGSNTLGYKQLFIDYTNTGTVGAVTINKVAGRVNLAAAGTSLVVTNSTMTANAHCFLNADGAPGNIVAVQLYAVPAAGSLTINAVPAVTNQTAIDFFCVNAD